MHKTIAILAGALALSACATNPRPVADVTRFYLAVPPQRSTVAVIAADPGLETSLAWRSDSVAILQRLQGIGYAPAPAEASDLLVSVRVTQQVRPGPTRPPALSIGLGGGTFGRNVGVGGGVNFPVGQARPTEYRETQLFMQMLRRADRTVVWEGRATALDDGAGGPIVPRLADALLAGFPGQSGRTVRVKLAG